MRLDLKTIVGIALSGLLLWWVLRDVSFAEVMRELRNADPLLFLLAVIAVTAQFPIRAARWKVLLLPVTSDLRFRPRFAATNIGFAANNLLPARVGEFARAYSLGRLTDTPVSAVLGTLVIERVLDGLVLVGLLFVSMTAPSFPSAAQLGGVDARAVAWVVGLISAALGLVLFLLVIAPRRSVRLAEGVARRLLPVRLRRPLLDALHSFLTGLGVLRDPRLLSISVAWAIGQWVFTGFSYLLAFWAFGITEPGFAGALFIQSLIAMAVAVPSSPGFFGPWEAGARLGLALWGVPADKAISFAVGFHLGGFIPVTVIGLYYLWRLDLRWRDIEQSEEIVEERVEREIGAPPSEPATGARDA